MNTSTSRKASPLAKVSNEIVLKDYAIDAAGKRLGRVATEAAAVLLGKTSPTHTKNRIEPVRVTITNAKLLDISEKRGKHVFQAYSGYPGGRKEETLEHLAKRRGYDEVVRRVVSGMIPKNKLHTPRMKNLIVTE